MPICEMQGGAFKIAFQSVDDWIGFVNQTVVPTGLQYGYRVVVERIPKDEPRVDRV